MYLGDFRANATVRGHFNTRKADGTPITLAGSPTLAVYKDGSTTESTAGVTLTVGFDSRTGLHLFAIDTSSDGAFYTAAADYRIVITAGTVDGISVVGTKVGEFSIENRVMISGQDVRDAMDLELTGGGDSIDTKLDYISTSVTPSYIETDDDTPGLLIPSGIGVVPANTIKSSGNNAAGLVIQGGSQSVTALLIYSALDDAIVMSGGQHAIDCEFISAGADAVSSQGAGSVTVKAHHVVGDVCVNMESSSVVTLTAESISCGSQLIAASDGGVINIQSHRISTPAVSIAQAGLQVTVKDAVIGGLSGAVTCSAGTLELINCFIRGSLTQSGTGVVRMSNTVVTGTITGTISEYHDLTQQDIRDSMKLAPSAGAAAANSIDDKIDDLAAGGTITHVGPVDPEGVITSPIIIGDDYLATNDRAFIWTIDEVDNFTVATAVSYLGLKKDDDNSIIKQGTVSDNNDGTWDLSIDLTRTDTASLEPGLYEWSVEIRSAGGTEITPVRYGERVRLVAKQT